MSASPTEDSPPVHQASQPRPAPNSVSTSDDKRKNRFGWVRRLMQQRQPPPHNHPRTPGKLSQLRFAKTADEATDEDQESSENYPPEDESLNSDIVSNLYNDNSSTVPLKSLGSTPLTVSPSVLSDQHPDGVSYVASTAETSIAPSTFPAMSQVSNTSTGIGASSQAGPDRDSESIVTLALLLRRTRRRSLETTSSTTGIPPASIVERLSAFPGTSIYARSVDRSSIYKDENSVVSDDHYDKPNDIRSEKLQA